MIYVLRHGETDWNKDGRVQGRNGIPLNEKGIEQAEKARRELNLVVFSHVYSSPQIRALVTAEIASGKAPIADDRLDVFDLGSADGLRNKNVKWSRFTPDPEKYEGVEDIKHFIGRVFSFMTELEKKHSESGENILIAGHRCTTGAIGAYFKGIPADQNILKFSSDNGEFHIYSFKEKTGWDI